MSSLHSNTTGAFSSAHGYQSLYYNTTGVENTAIGAQALAFNSAGAQNTAAGHQALYTNTTGDGNTAAGHLALYGNTTGLQNTAIGHEAGRDVGPGSFNVYLGASVTGTAADTNTMRLGLPYDGASGAGQNRTFIAGVAGTVLTTPAVQVFIDANGQLGTLTPPPITGSISGGLTPGATPQIDVAVLSRQLEEQRQLTADLQARLAVVEAERAARPRRP